MVEIQDRAAQGRACGNLGNVHYLLGDFTKAIHFHEERLKIAREFGDRSAERRAHSNLGNAHIFLGEFEAAAEHYKMTLGLAQELGDRAVEAQVRHFSLGDTKPDRSSSLPVGALKSIFQDLVSLLCSACVEVPNLGLGPVRDQCPNMVP